MLKFRPRLGVFTLKSRASEGVLLAGRGSRIMLVFRALWGARLNM